MIRVFWLNLMLMYGFLLGNLYGLFVFDAKIVFCNELINPYNYLFLNVVMKLIQFLYCFVIKDITKI
ncbi:hypothetical protein B4N84_13565 [Flavobacterium sp. IR1]|nr:hypothetical protein B4N84_13565 [Flavobacterium sp. IR1]